MQCWISLCGGALSLFCIFSPRYVSGMAGIVDGTEENSLDSEEDVGTQTTNALARVGQVLAEHGASPLSIIASVSIAIHSMNFGVELISGAEPWLLQ